MTGDRQTPVVDAWGDGAAFLVKAHAGARRDRAGGFHDGMLRVEVTAAPEKGKANKAILKLLAKSLGLPPSALVLLSGEANPKKRFGARGVTPEKLAAILMRLGDCGA